MGGLFSCASLRRLQCRRFMFASNRINAKGEGIVAGRGAEQRRSAALLFEQGWGYKAVSTELGINRQTVRDWMYAWKALGTE